MPLVTAAPASAHSAYMYSQAPATFASADMNFCVFPADYMAHAKWYAITEARQGTVPGDACGSPHGEPADGIRMDLWWYKNGNGSGGYDFRLHWGFFHNTVYDNQVQVVCNCVIAYYAPNGPNGYWSLDHYAVAADWWGNFQGGWAINIVHHDYNL